MRYLWKTPGKQTTKEKKKGGGGVNQPFGTEEEAFYFTKMSISFTPTFRSPTMSNDKVVKVGQRLMKSLSGFCDFGYGL